MLFYLHSVPLATKQNSKWFYGKQNLTIVIISNEMYETCQLVSNEPHCEKTGFLHMRSGGGSGGPIRGWSGGGEG